MNKNDAHQLLDGLRAGLPVLDALVTQALMATGDLTRSTAASHGWDMPSFVDDAPLVQIRRPAGTWERRESGLAPAQWHEAIA